MLTLITGTPGAGKTLYGVWELARHIPGSTIEVSGEAKPRRLCSNVKGLLLDHQPIDGADLEKWHTWAQPGDVIVFDEVQEVWRPRGMGSKVPEAIQAIETHRHMGVDIVLITQHPMLLDQNIRRLVNRHFHVRRVGALGAAVVYEWDHCSDPGRTKGAMGMKPWRYPRAAYKLYKSATAHTKPRMRVSGPVVAFVLALGALAYIGPGLYARMTDRYAGKPPDKPVHAAQALPGASAPARPSRPASAPLMASVAPPPAAPASRPVSIGCARMRDRCGCYDSYGEPAEKPADACMDMALANAPAKLQPAPASLARFEALAPAPPLSDADAAMVSAARAAGDRARARGVL